MPQLRLADYTSSNPSRRLLTLTRRNFGQHAQRDLPCGLGGQQNLRAALDKLFAVEWTALKKSKHACVDARSQEFDRIIAQAQSAGRVGMVEKPERRVEPESNKRAGAIAEGDRIPVIESRVARRPRPTWD